MHGVCHKIMVRKMVSCIFQPHASLMCFPTVPLIGISSHPSRKETGAFLFTCLCYSAGGSDSVPKKKKKKSKSSPSKASTSSASSAQAPPVGGAVTTACYISPAHLHCVSGHIWDHCHDSMRRWLPCGSNNIFAIIHKSCIIEIVTYAVLNFFQVHSNLFNAVCFTAWITSVSSWEMYFSISPALITHFT